MVRKLADNVRRFNLLFLKIVNDTQGTILRYSCKVSVIWRECKGIDALVGKLPRRHGVEFLVLGMDRLLHQNLGVTVLR